MVLDARFTQVIARVEVRPLKKPRSGTGFLIAPDLVLTARHVVASLPRPRKRAVTAMARGVPKPLGPEIWVTFPSLEPIAAEIAEDHINPDPELADWIVLRLKRQVDRAPLTAGCFSERRGQPLWQSWGYWKFPHLAHGFDVSGTVGAVEQVSQGRSGYFRLACAEAQSGASMEGLSGAPVFFEGEAVAIITNELVTEDGSGSAHNIAGALYAWPLSRIKERCPTLWPSWNLQQRLPWLPDVCKILERRLTLTSWIELAEELQVPEHAFISDRELPRRIARHVLRNGFASAAELTKLLQRHGKAVVPRADCAAVLACGASLLPPAEAAECLNMELVRASTPGARAGARVAVVGDREQSCVLHALNACGDLKVDWDSLCEQIILINNDAGEDQRERLRTALWKELRTRSHGLSDEEILQRIKEGMYFLIFRESHPDEGVLAALQAEFQGLHILLLLERRLTSREKNLDNLGTVKLLAPLLTSEQEYQMFRSFTKRADQLGLDNWLGGAASALQIPRRKTE